jgi:aminoglycoside phosphotransferase family enzyme/predicted kinase
MNSAAGHSAAASHDELLVFLRRPDSFPEKPTVVELRQTHISIIAIAPPHVYKIKKPLDLGFLDFSTLEKRRHFCEAEVRLNRRLTRDVYLGVVPISRRGGALEFGEEGEDSLASSVIEYAVKMRALPEDGFLDRRLARNVFTAADLDRLADKLSAFYRAQEHSKEFAEWGRVAKLQLSTDENFAQTECFAGTLLSHPAFEAIRYFTGNFYERRADLFERRRKGGHILDCHGDLRCEHIHFAGEEVNIFDCIEFNERFRCIDVANDLAFLAMDFDFLGRPDVDAAFVQRMASLLEDPELFALLDFYKCYRACVRAKVAAIKSEEAEVSTAEREGSRADAVRFFQFALAYAVAGSEPLVLVVMGRVGTGKSTVAQRVGDALGWPVFSSDRTRKELAGVTPHTRGDVAARAELYAGAMTRRTYDALIYAAVERARSRGSSILDATFGKRDQRELLREKLAAAGIRHRFVEITASDEEVIARLRRRDDSEAEVSDARLEDFEMLTAGYEPPDSGDEQLPVESHPSLEATLTEFLKALVRPQT